MAFRERRTVELCETMGHAGYRTGLAADDCEVAQARFLALETTKPTQGVGYDVSLNWESGGVLLSHGGGER